jgi:hypothetical protein
MTKNLTNYFDILGLDEKVLNNLNKRAAQRKIRDAFNDYAVLCHPDKYEALNPNKCEKAKEKTPDGYQRAFDDILEAKDKLLSEFKTQGERTEKAGQEEINKITADAHEIVLSAEGTAEAAHETLQAMNWAKEALEALTRVTEPSIKLEKSIEALNNAKNSLTEATTNLLICETQNDCTFASKVSQEASMLLIEAAKSVEIEAAAVVETHKHTHKIIENHLHHFNYDGDVTLLGDTIAIFKAAGWDFV